MSFVFQDLEIIKNPGLHAPQPTLALFPKRFLIWLSYWDDAKISGFDAAAWRRTNMLIHVVNAALLASISPWAALLFLVHPLTTMGSSYVAGRSGVLSATFQITAGLLALNGWILPAIVVALIATRWLKEDSAIFFPMIAALRWVS